MITSLLLAALLAGAPAASDKTEAGDGAVTAKLQQAFKGTIVSTYADGRKGHLLLSADHTYRYTGRTGTKSGGTWALNDDKDKICMKQKRPTAIPFGYCTPIPSGKTWKAKAAGGEPVTLSITSGRAG